MNEFAVVCEGVTDFSVIKNILLGWFRGQSAEPFLKPYQPDSTADGDSAWQKFGNWENVIRYLKEKKHRDALEFADFLIVQIDADECHHPGFCVDTRDGDGEADTAELVRRVKDRLKEFITQEDFEFYENRIIFAICVREIECWLLPIWDSSKRGKEVGCLGTLNRALARKNEKTINPDDKCPRHYDLLSRSYKKRDLLLAAGSSNVSLGHFLEELQRGTVLCDEP